MRLAIVTPYPPKITGIGQYGYHISRLLARSGVFSEVTVLTGHNSVARVDIPEAMKIEHSWEPDHWQIGSMIPRSLERIQPDLVWFNLGVSVFGSHPLANLSGFLSILQAKRSGLPVVVTLHELPELVDLQALFAPGGFLAPIGARLLTQIATRGDVTCLTTRKFVDWLAQRHTTSSLVHIPLGSYNGANPLPATDAPELLLFTTLAPFKGIELLLQAYQELRNSHPNLRLTVAGAEHARFPGYIHQVRQKYDQLDGINWLGQVPESEVNGLFQRAKLVVLPYTASTGSSSVLWQAATFGRAMIVSDLDEIHADVSEAGLDVTFFRQGDAHHLAEAICKMLVSPSRYWEQVQINLAAVQRSQPKKTCEAYLRAFNLALKARRSPKRIPLMAPSEETA